jgi:CheY-like chemotaxis protein
LSQLEDTEPPRELLTAWVQFLRSDLTEAVNALHNRLSVISLAASADEGMMSPEQRENLRRIKAEVSRAAKITTGLLHRVNASAPDTLPQGLAEYDGSSLGSARILVVEGDEANRIVIAKLLERLGHQVTSATNGLDAFEIIRHGDSDCIVADIRLPYLGGRTLFQQVEERLPHMASRFVFVTGDYTNPESRSFLDSTGQPVIGKPYELEALLGAVAEVVRKNAASRAS